MDTCIVRTWTLKKIENEKKKINKKKDVRNIYMNKWVFFIAICFLRNLIKHCQSTLSTLTVRQRPKNQEKKSWIQSILMGMMVN